MPSPETGQVNPVSSAENVLLFAANTLRINLPHARAHYGILVPSPLCIRASPVEPTSFTPAWPILHPSSISRSAFSFLGIRHGQAPIPGIASSRFLITVPRASPSVFHESDETRVLRVPHWECHDADLRPSSKLACARRKEADLALSGVQLQLSCTSQSLRPPPASPSLFSP